MPSNTLKKCFAHFRFSNFTTLTLRNANQLIEHYTTPYTRQGGVSLLMSHGELCNCRTLIWVDHETNNRPKRSFETRARERRKSRAFTWPEPITSSQQIPNNNSRAFSPASAISLNMFTVSFARIIYSDHANLPHHRVDNGHHTNLPLIRPGNVKCHDPIRAKLNEGNIIFAF